MGCVATKLEEEEEVVSICRERKHQLKLAVERRYDLADAHYKYCQALYGVSAAIKLFVARHSSASPPYLITFPPASPPSPPKEKVVSNPLFLQQSVSESAQETMVCGPCKASTSSDSSEEEQEESVEKGESHVCGYFYMDMPQMMPSPHRDFGWDFFNPFTAMRPEMMNGYNKISEEDLRAVREQEGIPELEEEEEEGGVRMMEEQRKMMVAEEKQKAAVETEKKGLEVAKSMDGGNVSQEEEKGLAVVDTPLEGRELLEALQDIEDHFIRAYDSGKEVSRMLEANWAYSQSNLEELKENSVKMIQALPWRSTSSRSSSCKSLVAASSKSSSTWTEFKNDLFDDYGGMGSGSHSLTLGRLYAWEKKLYEEVKAGDSTWKLYERRCNQLSNNDVRGYEGRSVDKTRAAVKDLYSRILVAIRSAETISRRIEKLRDEELQPQILELLQGMLRTWKIMSESHEIQNKIIVEVKTFSCPTYGKFCNDSHRLATLQLEAELNNWRACFREYVAAQKAYVESLHGWLSKFILPEVEYYSKSRSSIPPCQTNGPTLLVICRDWLSLLERLPEKDVCYAIKCCGKDIRTLWVQQGEEQQQKRKVDGLSKELDKRILAFQKAENRIFELRLTDNSPEIEIEHRAEYLKEKRDLLDNFRKRVELEKEKHQKCMVETKSITLRGFQTGFGRVFESMMDFSKAALKMYQDILSEKEDAEKGHNPSCIEDAQHESSNR